jgi:hypothetical protein
LGDRCLAPRRPKATDRPGQPRPGGPSSALPRNGRNRRGANPRAQGHEPDRDCPATCSMQPARCPGNSQQCGGCAVTPSPAAGHVAVALAQGRAGCDCYFRVRRASSTCDVRADETCVLRNMGQAVAKSRESYEFDAPPRGWSYFSWFSSLVSRRRIDEYLSKRINLVYLGSNRISLRYPALV